MYGCIRSFSKLLIRGSSHKHVRCFYRYLEFMKIVVLQQLDMIKTAFYHRVGAWLAVFFQQVPFQRPCIHPYANRTAMILGRTNNLGHPLGIANIARVDPQTGRPSLCRLNRAFVVKMDIRNDRHRAFRHNLPQSPRAFLIWGRYPHNISTRNRTALHLFNRGLDVCGQGIGHGLH